MTEQDMGMIYGLGVITGVAISALVSFLTDLFS
jgi:hypothetical protein